MGCNPNSEASSNAVIDVIGLDFQLSNSLEEERQTGEGSETAPAGTDLV